MQGTPIYKKDVDTLIQRPRYLARPTNRDKKCPRQNAWAFAYLILYLFFYCQVSERFRLNSKRYE